MKNKYLHLARTICRHKWYVLLECCQAHMPLHGVIHDLSKFSPQEFMAYADKFDPNKPSVRDKTGYYRPYGDDAAFDKAWLHHIRHNDHHWQAWIIPADGKGENQCLPMRHGAIVEMLCDWRGAGKAYGTPIEGPYASEGNWYVQNGHKMQLHRDTRDAIEDMLDISLMDSVEIGIRRMG